MVRRASAAIDSLNPVLDEVEAVDDRPY